MMGLLLEDEADCLNHQHKHRRHRRPIRRQSWAAAPYRASGLVLSAFADIEAGCVNVGNLAERRRTKGAVEASIGVTKISPAPENIIDRDFRAAAPNQK
jgi:hypothetical protein